MASNPKMMSDHPEKANDSHVCRIFMNNADCGGAHSVEVYGGPTISMTGPASVQYCSIKPVCHCLLHCLVVVSDLALSNWFDPVVMRGQTVLVCFKCSLIFQTLFWEFSFLFTE